MQNRIKRHFILAGEAATDGPGIVKNCEHKSVARALPSTSSGQTLPAHTLPYRMQHGQKRPRHTRYCWVVGGVLDGRSLRGATYGTFGSRVT